VGQAPAVVAAAEQVVRPCQQSDLRVITVCDTRQMNGPGSDIAASILRRWVTSYLQLPYERSREALGDPANGSPRPSGIGF